MKFGPLPLAQAEGAILAHSVQAGATKLRKGLTLDATHLRALRDGGVASVVVARLEPGDIEEDAAATRLAQALLGPGVRATPAFTGRVNIEAVEAGLLRFDRAALEALNRIDPGITLATLPDYTRVAPGMMLATVKIIPYAVPDAALQQAMAAAQPLSVAQAQVAAADLILTETPGFAPKLLAKGERVVRERLAGLGVRLAHVVTVAHETGAVAQAVRVAKSPLVLILGASATSDVRDVCPAGVVAAGGRLQRFGMPVDPGNLLFLGEGPSGAVIGLPGCARSPALNGADWVLERLVCGLSVTDADIAAMGVGGLLKEIPIRPQPRVIRAVPSAEPRVEIVMLAAGQAARMNGIDKLTEPLQDGQPLLARSVAAAMASAAQAVHLVLPPDRPERLAVAKATGAEIVIAAQAREGMGASLAAGMRAVSDDSDAVIVALADMPDVTSEGFDRLIAAFDAEAGREICRAAAADGAPGHPVLFGRRFFESLGALGGDTGARDVVQAGRDFLVDVPLPGQAAVTDLDTPEAWAVYRAGGGGT